MSFSTSQIGLMLLAMSAGAVMPLQAGANAQLAGVIGHPLWASLTSLVISAALLPPLMMAVGTPAPAIASATAAPWWVWLGGLIGVYYVTTSLMVAPQLGAVTFIACVIAGQMVASVLLDNYALAGFIERTLNPTRIIGIALIIGGVFLVQTGGRTPTGS